MAEIAANSVPVLTVDGPSGSGKGTVGQLIARQKGWHYLDSGGVYRVVALLAGEAGIENDIPAILHMIAELQLETRWSESGAAQTFANGRDVSEAIRQECCGELASQLAVNKSIRAALLDLQRRTRKPPGLVADGRDMGTVVFPDARLKIYLTASPEVRAKRRYKQLIEKGFDVNLPRLHEELVKRDTRDQQRSASPLSPAADAVMLDTSHKSIQQVVEEIIVLFSGLTPEKTVDG